MDAIDALHNRASTPARLIGAPAPAGDDLQVILRAAASAPDHGALRPWRLIIIEGDGLQALGDVFVAACVAAQPDADEGLLSRQRDKAMCSPMLIVVAAEITPDHPKVPEWEQIVSAGCAAEHVQIAAQALGYASIWVTGDKAQSPVVKRSLGLADKDRIVGFLHLGTARGERRAPPRLAPDDYALRWQGPPRQGED